MRRFFLSFALSLVILATLTAPAWADPGTVRTGAGFIWVRSGPATTYPAVGRLNNGSSIEIAAAVRGQAVNAGNSTWYQIGPGRYVYSGLVQTRTPAAPPASPPTAPVSPPAGGEKWIEVILSQQRLLAYEGDRVRMNTLISSGKLYTPTVRGEFSVYAKYRSTRMSGPGYNIPNVPHAMFFYGGYSLHGAFWHNNFGHPMSHGCVNTALKDAAWLFNWAPVGTRVYIH